jgi:hypothetical protein
MVMLMTATALHCPASGADGALLPALQGAATQMYAATAPAGRILGGEYYSDCQIELSSVPSHHEKLAQQLWDLSEDICAPYLK